MKVSELEPGQQIINPIDGSTPCFIVAFAHPYYDGLAQVVWRMPDGTSSFDALSWHQDVGEPVPASESERVTNLRDAIGEVVT